MMPQVLLAFLLIKRHKTRNRCEGIKETIAVSWHAISREPVMAKQNINVSHQSKVRHTTLMPWVGDLRVTLNLGDLKTARNCIRPSRAKLC